VVKKRLLIVSLFSLGMAFHHPVHAQQVRCLPPSDTAKVASEEPIRAGKIRFYQDASLSMQGFNHDSRRFPQAERHYVTLARDLPDLTSRALGLPVEKKIFSALKPEPFPKTSPLTDAFYEKREFSRLDLVLDLVTQDLDAISVVITDLAFRTPADLPGGMSLVANQLARILSDGRAVALVGLANPFSGNVSQVIKGRVANRPYDGMIPVYVIAVGPLADVQAFVAAFRQKVLAAVSPDKIKVALYVDAMQQLRGASRVAGDNIRRPDPLLVIPNTQVQQVEVTDRVALNLRLDLGPLSGMADSAVQITSVSGDHAYFQYALSQHMPSAPCESGWRARPTPPIVSAGMSKDDRVVVSLTGKTDMLPAQIIHALRSKIVARDFSATAAVNNWITDFSLPPEEQSATVDTPFLRTPGLLQLHESLLTALKKQIQEHPAAKVIGESTLVFKID